MENLFFELLQLALGIREGLSRRLTVEEWRKVYEEAKRQSLIGVMFCAVERMPQEWRPEAGLLMEWIGWTARIEELNLLMDREAARLTSLFEAEGLRTAILKGQANARLYKSATHDLKETTGDTVRLANRRQPGDIDIWVDGGREKVVETLVKTGLVSKREDVAEGFCPGKAMTAYHHVHLPMNENGITVEVHFRPSSGNFNKITNRRLQRYLSETMDEWRTEKGFNVPSRRFALVMQLAHIQRHFFDGGIGMRQLVDYYFLLKESTVEADVTETLLRRLGLRRIAGAVMWVIQEVFCLDRQLMLCEPDERRGKWLLRVVMEGGNFGRYKKAGLWKSFFIARLEQIRLLVFDFWEGLWSIGAFLKSFVERIPSRIKYRTLSLNRVVHENK